MSRRPAEITNSSPSTSTGIGHIHFHPMSAAVRSPARKNRPRAERRCFAASPGGTRTKEIGRELHISVKTVESHPKGYALPP
jgi:DNA-binding NarL/FixJ family response regulator